MEDKHKKALQSIIPLIVKIENFDDVVAHLIELGTYTKDKVDVLINGLPSTTLQAQNLLLDLQTKGPTAFKHLHEALLKTGNGDLASKLENKDEASAFSDYDDTEEDEIDSNSNLSFSTTSKKAKYDNEDRDEENYQGGRTDEDSNSQPILSRRIPEIKMCVRGNEKPGITVIPATKLYNGYRKENECYPMKSKPRGLALIVNNIEFVGDPLAKRTGAEYDSVNLRHLFEEMGYKVVVAENITKKKFLGDMGVLSEFIKELKNANVDSCIISLNSHGFDRDLIRMADQPGRANEDNSIDLSIDVIRRFSNRNFPAFFRKPKVFLVNACRGTNSNRAIRNSFLADESDGCLNENVMPRSEFSDIFILRSTVPGYVSQRDLDKGTWFVECLCKAFALFSHKMHFAELKSEVSHFMESKYDETTLAMQSCNYEEYGITKHLYFNPGL